MNGKKSDIQIEKILSGLESLIKQLREPLAQSVLDFDRNVKTNKYNEFLIKLKKSLTQYAEKGGNLLYTGFVGHYSAGKSSTINSLLDLWDEKGSREVGLNPTDRSITLVTQNDNSSYLIGIIREGSISIRTSFHDSPLLKNLVIADTPGTGDPHLIEEMARDFLPICDLILFFLSAANPLDETDIPILLEVHNRLSFIPIKFVVTRADEFIKNKREQLDTSNFDEIKSETFLAGLISRLNKLTTSFNFSNKDFILIDNIEKFNINELKKFLMNASDKDHLETYVSMHANKLSFYISNANEAKEFFQKHIEENLKELTRIVSNAEKMIEEYHDKVQITNSRLTSIWSEKKDELIKIKERDLIHIQDEEILPSRFDELEFYRKNILAISKKIKKNSKEKFDDLKNFIVFSIKEKLRNYFNDIRQGKKINTLSKMSLGELEYLVFNKEETIQDRINIELPITIISLFENFQKDSHQQLLDIKTGLLNKIKKIRLKSRKKVPLLECKEKVQDAANSLSDDIEPYFANVVIYRTSVFSHKVKESIEKLGIGKKLDSLDYDFSENDKDKIKELTQEQIFPKFNDLNQKYEIIVSDLSEEINSLYEEVTRTRINPPDITAERYSEKIKNQQISFIDGLFQKAERELNKTRDYIFENMHQHAVNKVIKYKKEIGELKRKQKIKTISYFSIIAITVFFIGYFVSYKTGFSEIVKTYLASLDTRNFWLNSIVGVFCSMTANLICMPIIKRRDNYPKEIEDLKQGLSIETWSSTQSLIDVELGEYKFPQETAYYIKNSIEEAWMAIVSNEDLKDSFKSSSQTYDDLVQFDIKLNMLIKKYEDIIDDMCPKYIEYFNDINANLEKLKNISNKVKEEAIEPSFKLLAETQDKLVGVRDKINEISFT